MEKNFYKILCDLGLDDASLKPLYKDASNRTYYRITHSTGTLVLMLQDSPIKEDDLNIASIEDFRRLGIKVPKVHKVFHKEGVVIQEDLGDTHLESVKDFFRLKTYYRDAVRTLLAFQKAAYSSQDNGVNLAVSKNLFTSEKFLSELKMSTDYYINRYKGLVLASASRLNLERFYKDLVSKMISQPFLLQHRDYHSRNIMIKEEELFLIDLQDSRLGPLAYDIASLMIDPYMDLNEDIINDCLLYYYNGIKDLVPCSYDEFICLYRECYLQRGIKILGTFSYQKIEKNNDKYLTYIPITLNKIRETVKYFPEWNEIITEAILS